MTARWIQQVRCDACRGCWLDPKTDRCMYGGPYAGYLFAAGADNFALLARRLDGDALSAIQTAGQNLVTITVSK